MRVIGQCEMPKGAMQKGAMRKGAGCWSNISILARQPQVSAVSREVSRGFLHTRDRKSCELKRALIYCITTMLKTSPKSIFIITFASRHQYS